MNRSLNILLVDDDEDDYIILREMLSEFENMRVNLEWVDDYASAILAVQDDTYDVCLVDYRLGADIGLDLIRDAIELGCHTPMILMTGQGGQEVDVAAMNAGAMDYLVKGKCDPIQLERSIRYAIERRRIEREKEQLITELQKALAQVKQLNGLLPICCACKKIRDDGGYWNQLESYISDHSSADFTHGICPDCISTLYPQLGHTEDNDPSRIS